MWVLHVLGRGSFLFWPITHMGHKTGVKYTIYTHLKTSQISQNSLPLFLEYHLKGTIFYTLNIPVSTYVIEGNLGVKLPTSGKMQQQLWKESN